MARYAYDVNTTQRYIDVHKQFQGGLKTVDTDDALGAVFLREAQNVSLSEFGFIEKRYGTFEKEKVLQTNGKLQGYWEYFGFSIFVVDGVFYYKGVTGDAVQVTKIYQESTDPDAPSTIFGEDWRYPLVFGSTNNFVEVTGCEFTAINTFASQTDVTTPVGERDTCGEGEDASTKNDYVICNITFENAPDGLNLPFYTCQTFSASDTTRTTPVYENNIGFPTDIDINGVNVNNVLYIFTGKYPVYVKLVQNGATGLSTPRFYAFPITIPTYDEVVVTGHNLLEYNYNQVYYKTKSEIQYTNPGVSSITYSQFTSNQTDPPFFVVQKENTNAPEEKQYAPQIPFQDGGQLHFNFKYVMNPTYLQAYDAVNQQRLYVLDVENVAYRNTGTGASEYFNTDISSVEFEPLSNYTGSNQLIASVEGPILKIDVTKDFSQNPTTPLTKDLYYYLNVDTSDASGNGLAPITFSIDFNSQRNQLTSNLSGDTIEKDDFKKGQEFEFRLLKLTNASTGTTEPIFIPISGSDVEDNFFDTFSPVSGQSWSLTNYNSAQTPRIIIEPLDASGNVISNYTKVLTIANSGLSLTSSGYKFTVPSDLLDSSVVVNYRVGFTGSFSATTVANISGTTALPNPTIVYKELVRLETLSQQRSLSTSQNIGITLNNLIAGSYDFKITYRLSKYTLTSGNILRIVEQDDGIEFADVNFFNITITPEKLQDLPGQTEDFLPKLKPIWTCNRVIEHYGKLMVWGSSEMPTAIFYSFPDRPTYFPSKFYLDFSNDTNQKIQSVSPFMNILVAQTEDRTWGIRGNSGLIDSPAPYIPFGINNTVGTIAPKSVRPVRNHLFFLSNQGVIALKSLYAADEQYNIEFVDRNIRNIVPQDTDAVGVQFDNQYWLNFPNDRITLRWYIDKKAWVKDVYNSWNDFNGILKYQIKNGKLEFITLPSKFTENENPAIYNVGVDYTLPTDLGGTVLTKFETSYLNQNYPFHPKNYKEAKFDFTLQNEYNLSRDTIYEMQNSEHITDGVTHKMDNVTLTKNHRYRIVYSFSEHSQDEDITSGGGFTSLSVPSDSISGGDFVSEPPTIIFGAITFSLLGASDLQVTSVILTDKDNNQTILLPNSDFNIIEKDNFDYYVEFLLPNSIDGIVDIIVTGEFSTYNDGAVIYDITYDSDLKIYNWVISEDQTLNLDNLSSYDQSKAEFNIDFNSRLGTWVFGTSDFGNKVTAVKTEKLSGKGYNAKVYVEDFSKSKWTLESLGLTYKMKRARSR